MFFSLHKNIMLWVVIGIACIMPASVAQSDARLTGDQEGPATFFHGFLWF